MRQRLGLAFALLGNPRVLLLDEPANGLDPEGIRWLRGFLRALADEGRTVLVSSHLLTEVQQSADRVVILSQGRLVREGSVVELEQGAGVTVVVRSPTLDKLGAALAAAGVTATRSGDGRAAGARAATPPRSGTRRSRPASSCTSCAPSGPTWSSCSSSSPRAQFHAQDGRVAAGAVPGAPPGPTRDGAGPARPDHARRCPVTVALRAESRKLLTTQVWFWMFVLQLGLTLLVACLVSAFSKTDRPRGADRVGAQRRRSASRC